MDRNVHAGEVALELLAEALEGHDNTVSITASGHCMWPLVRDGDVLTVVRAVGSPPSGALVVARQDDGGVVCHRSLGCSLGDAALLLAADRSRSAQEIPRRSVIGVVCTVARDARALDVERWLPRWLGRLQAAVQRLVQENGLLWSREAGEARWIGKAVHRAINLLQSAAWLIARRAATGARR